MLRVLSQLAWQSRWHARLGGRRSCPKLLYLFGIGQEVGQLPAEQRRFPPEVSARRASSSQPFDVCGREPFGHGES